jgi:hypothetical protein
MDRGPTLAIAFAHLVVVLFVLSHYSVVTAWLPLASCL